MGIKYNPLINSGLDFTGSSGGGGGVTNVSASSPLASSGGTTPNITIQTASGSQAGSLSATDWTTFNNKQAGPLTGDVTTSGVVATLKAIPNKVYVDFISGNDSNTGTIVSPWKTLQHAYNSISPSINEPYNIYISGGNNDTDIGPITAKPNVNLIADYQIQINPAFTISGGTTNDNATFVNINFIGAFTWTRNDTTVISTTFVNCNFFNGPTIKQTGAGSAGANLYYTTTVNADFKISNGGFMVSVGTSFLGTTTFEDSTNASFYQITGGYFGGPVSISGGPTVYFAGNVVDVAFGASMTFTTTANGSPTIETDSAGLPPTYTGTPTITYLSQSQTMNNTKGYAIGDVSSPTETNVLLSVKDGHIKSKQTTAPTITVSPNAGTGASASLTNATDTKGLLQLTFGSASFSAGVQVTVNFNKAYNIAPIVTISPANAETASEMGSVHQIYVTSSTAGFSINYGLAQNSSGAVCQWNYHIIE